MVRRDRPPARVADQYSRKRATSSLDPVAVSAPRRSLHHATSVRTRGARNAPHRLGRSDDAAASLETRLVSPPVSGTSPDPRDGQGPREPAHENQPRKTISPPR